MINKETRILIARAISNARESYENTFEKEGVDCAFYRMKIEVISLDNQMEEILGTITDEDEQIKRREK